MPTTYTSVQKILCSTSSLKSLISLQVNKPILRFQQPGFSEEANYGEETGVAYTFNFLTRVCCECAARNSLTSGTEDSRLRLLGAET